MTASKQQTNQQGSRKWGKSLVRLILVAGLALGLYWGYWETLGHRFSTISPNQVYKSAALSPAALAKVVRDKNLRSVVDLRDRPQGLMPADERTTLQDLGVRYFHLPTPQVPSLETVDQFLELSSDPANFPMLIHCHHGEGRSVLFSALYRIEFEGWSIEEARKATRVLHFRGTFGPDGPKGRFMRSYTPRLPRLKESAAGWGFPASFAIAEPRFHATPSPS